MIEQYPLMANAATSTLDNIWEKRCAASPDHVFLIEKNKKVTYAQLDCQCTRIINLFQQHNIEKKELVVVQLPINVLNVEILISCFKLNIVAMPLSMHVDKQEFERVLELMQPKLVILSNKQLNYVLNKKNTKYEAISSLDASVSCFRLKEQHNPAKLPADIAAILLTSGTTGSPKGVMLSHRNILYSEIYFSKEYHITNKDILLLALPLNHAIGFHHGIVTTILTGSTCVLFDEYCPQDCFDIINKHHCTYMLAVPTIVYDLFSTIPAKHYLKKIICGGSPIPWQLQKEAIIKQVPVYNVFGATECVPFACTDPKYYQQKNWLTDATFPIPGVDIQIINSNGKEIKDTYQSGEIIVKGPVVFQGYFRDVKATEVALDKQNWFHTGDLGHYNSDFALKVDGRISDIILRGGEKIASQKIEKQVMVNQKVQQAAAVGIADKRLGERIGICIVLKDRNQVITLKELIDFLKKQHVLKKYWPEQLFIYQSFPTTDSGKVKKTIMKQQINSSK